MELKEKIRLFNGVGSWKTYTADGKIPQVIMSDGPHGLRKQEVENYADLNKSNVATCFPTASCMASSWDKAALKLLGKSIAMEALSENVHLMLGCGMNIKRSPLCGRNFEYFSEDPYLTGTLASEYVKGMQENGVGACIKHFACNNQEKRRQTSSSNLDKKTLHEIYLRGFEIAVKNAKPVSIMCSYNKINGVYAAQNKYLLTDVLRNKWGFDGAVISDWGACIDAEKCIKAGMDLAMPDSNGYFDMQLENAIKKGTLLEAEVDVANRRIIEMAGKLIKMREKVLENKPDKTAYVDYAHQYLIALKLATESAVLLQNDGILPLSAKVTKKDGKNKNQSLLVIGELAEYMKFQAGGSSHITTAEYANALTTFQKEGFEVDYAKGYFSGFCKLSKIEKKNKPLLQEALKKAKIAAEKNVPVMFFCGLTEAYEGEGFDRSDLKLPFEQIELLSKLLEITENVIVVSFSGAPIDLSLAKNARAILHMYLCGEACGQAVADLITGKANPSGKLAETWPCKIEDTPCYKNFALSTDDIQYSEKEFVGYRWYESNDIPVQYPFGFGLSYASFEYSKLNIDKLGDGIISVNVKNAGKVEGAEVIQLYVQRDGEKYRQLRGFEKLSILPGEEKTVSICLDDNVFKSYDVLKDSFVTVKGDYTICVGASIKDIRLSQKILIDGEDLPGDNLEEFEFYAGTDFESQKLINEKKSTVFTISDSMGDMAEKSLRVRILLKIFAFAIRIMNKGKSKEDPAVKIAVSALEENPLESLISTSGGVITYKFAKRIVKWSN